MQVMEQIFAPRSVAVVGVPRGMKTGRLFLEALLKPGFKGPIYPVNPNADEILGLKTYPSVSAIGEPVDLAIVATPPGAATSVIADCGRPASPPPCSSPPASGSSARPMARRERTSCDRSPRRVACG